jgi:5'-3' exonuclease
MESNQFVQSKIAWIDGDVLHHWSLWETTSVESYQANVTRNIADWTEGPVADSSVIALSGLKNFRNDLYGDYKKTASRQTARSTRPAHEADCLNWLRSLPNTVTEDNLEADDILAIGMTADPDSTVIVTVDKDLLQVSGHHFNPRAGNCFVDKKEAFRNLQLQLIQGDPMDRIPGLPGIGPKKAKLFIDQGGDPLDLYKSVMKDQWLEWFEFNGKLLFLLRFLNDAFNLGRYEELRDEQRSLETLST